MQEYFIRGTAASPLIPMASPKDLPHWKIHPVRERSFTHFRMAASVPHWMCSRRHWYSSSRLCSSGQGRFRCRGMSSRCPAGQTTGWICLSFLCFFIKSLPRFSLSAFFSKKSVIFFSKHGISWTQASFLSADFPDSLYEVPAFQGSDPAEPCFFAFFALY